MKTLHVFFATILLLLSSCSTGHITSDPTRLPGRLPDGSVVLPNGWYLSPAGTQVGVGELPLNMVISPDGRYIVTCDNGTGRQTLSIIERASAKVMQTVPLYRSWVGLRFADQGRALLVSGGNANCVYRYSFADGKAALRDSISLGTGSKDEELWIAGLDVDEATQTLYVVGMKSLKLYVIDLASSEKIHELTLPATPYTCLFSPRHKLLYVSLWGSGQVACVDPARDSIVAQIPVGPHPNDMVESQDGTRLFVANGNANSVDVIDIQRRLVNESIRTSLRPNDPAGSTPNSVALSPDGKRLYVANADNNYVAVMDISRPGQSSSLGFIPVGWYPTAVRVHPVDGTLLVANGKGSISAPNPKGPSPERRGGTTPDQYTGSMFKGTVSIIASPDARTLETYSTQVFKNCPDPNRHATTPAWTDENPIPRRKEILSPIKHVFYIIKENRTYDQVFGDLPQGNGDSSLCIFPARITPNLHALVNEFVLLDNFYADAEVSADGHNWSMAAYANDYVEKTWPTSYGGRGGSYEFEGGYPMVYPEAGYIWDNCRRGGVSYRTYGEFAINGATPADSSKAANPGLEGHVAPFYRGWDMSFSDVDRVKQWMKEFDEYERIGGLPSFQIIKLPNDHTEGTHRGSLTPRAFVAQNDLAVGMVVERISHSKFWGESAIFIIEDDAQNGPDHVDAHRTEAMVISPYVRHHAVDSELYSTSSMVRTMELILGLPPLSQFDAAATPMFASFMPKPDLTPYTARPANVDPGETNPAGTYGQAESEQMDFSIQDATPEIALNEIIWRSIKGEHARMPAPVRSAFVRTREREEGH